MAARVPTTMRFFRTGLLVVLIGPGIWPAALCAQQLLAGASRGGQVFLFPSDAAVLEAGEPRQDLPCTVTAAKPILGFDLRFHSGYDVAVPLKELTETDHLVMVFRVTPQTGDPVLFQQRLNVPKLDPESKGSAFLHGTFEMGEGGYHVDWLMRDAGERVCSTSWDVEANLPEKEKETTLSIPAYAVEPEETEPFRQEPPVERERDYAVNVKVIVNFAPQDDNAAALQPLDLHALCSILRSIAREPRIGKFTVVAYNMQEQKVIYREEDAARIDFPALGKALESLNLGTVDLKQLAQKNSDAMFLADLVTHEVAQPSEVPDAVIFAGPKVVIDGNLPSDALKKMDDVKTPVFYLNYNLNPMGNPWKDALGGVVRRLKGTQFTISRPRDLVHAWGEIMGRIVKSKSGGAGDMPSSQ